MFNRSGINFNQTMWRFFRNDVDPNASWDYFVKDSAEFRSFVAEYKMTNVKNSLLVKPIHGFLEAYQYVSKAGTFNIYVTDNEERLIMIQELLWSKYKPYEGPNNTRIIEDWNLAYMVLRAEDVRHEKIQAAIDLAAAEKLLKEQKKQEAKVKHDALMAKQVEERRLAQEAKIAKAAQDLLDSAPVTNDMRPTPDDLANHSWRANQYLATREADVVKLTAIMVAGESTYVKEASTGGDFNKTRGWPTRNVFLHNLNPIDDEIAVIKCYNSNCALAYILRRWW
jgi:hypothetical protein